MAQQKGISPLRGSIGNVNYYKSKNGFLAREKGGVSAEKIANDPRFERTRENNQEFGRAGKAGKYIRDALRMLLLFTADSTLVPRLTALLMRVIKADMTNPRGMRTVQDGEPGLLQGFNANNGAVLSSTFYAPVVSVVDRVTGKCTITIQPFVSTIMIAGARAATHFKLSTGAASIDFENGNFESAFTDSGNLPLNNQSTTLMKLTVDLPPDSPHPTFLALAIEFLQEVNGVFYPLKSSGHNSMCIVKVDTV